MAGRRPSQCALMLERLADGGLHSTVELNALGVGRPNSRSSELHQRHGYSIECVHVRGAEGAQAYQYRLLAVPAVSVHGLESQLSPAARQRVDGLRPASPVSSEPAQPVPHRDPSKAQAEEAGPFPDGGRRDAQGGPAREGPHTSAQLSLDELAGIENELDAMRSLGALAGEERDRFELLQARRDELDRSAA